MKRRPAVRAVSVGVLFVAVIGGGRPERSRAQPSALYDVRFLSSLGGTNSRGNSVNDEGWVAGYSNLENNHVRHAALWRGATPTDIGVLGSSHNPKNSNIVWPVKNTGGLLVGISQTDSPDPWGENWSCSAFFVTVTSTGYRCLGFAWQSGVMRPLPTLGGTHGYAAAANNLGQIVGWAENTVRDSTCTPPQIFQFRAVVWGPDGNRIHELPLYANDSSSAATAINDGGQIAGISGDCDDAIGSATAAHAVLWEGGTVIHIGNLGGKEWNTPTAINAAGDIAGFSDHEGDQITEAFIWTRDTGLQGLGFLYPDDSVSEAFGINDRRQVVGLSCGAAACRAFLWQNGVMTDLTGVAAVPDTVLLTHAMDINNAGVITGRAFNATTNELQAYVATPAAAGSQFALARPGSIGGRAGQQRPAITLPVSVRREILYPFGPGRDSVRAQRVGPRP